MVVDVQMAGQICDVGILTNYFLKAFIRIIKPINKALIDPPTHDSKIDIIMQK